MKYLTYKILVCQMFHFSLNPNIKVQLFLYFKKGFTVVFGLVFLGWGLRVSGIIFSFGSNSLNTAVYLCIYQSYLSFTNLLSVNKTSTKARLAPGSYTVENRQFDNCTLLSVRTCSAWPKPFCLSVNTPATHVRESYQCSLKYLSMLILILY